MPPQPRFRLVSSVQVGRAVMRSFAGRLDEHVDGNVLEPPHGCEHFVLDLESITHVASFGVREWIRILKALSMRVKLYYVRASPRVTDQFNMVMGFDAGGTLLSFGTYYLCDHCGEETQVLFDCLLDKEIFASLQPPSMQCHACGGDAHLDDEPGVLFEYVRSVELNPPPSEVMQLFRHAQNWVTEIPGIRLSVRQLIKQEPNSKGLGYKLLGVIDQSFSASAHRIIENVGDDRGQTIHLALDTVRHFHVDAKEPWRAFVADLGQKAEITLEGCSPIMLRRFADDTSLIGRANVGSVLLPVRCSQCQARSCVRLAMHAVGRFLSSARDTTQQRCLTCAGVLELLGSMSEIRSMVQTIASAPKEQVAASSGFAAIATAKDIPLQRRESTRVGGNNEDLLAKYEILGKIGQGGMAEIYLVRQRASAGFGRIAIAKSIKGDLVLDDRFVRMFLDEARLASRIDHTNVVRIHEFGRGEHSFVMTMEFVHGRSLAELLHEVTTENVELSPALAATIVADLCAGLARAHVPDAQGHRLVHRDVTPANVLISFEGTVKLVDFGLAGYARRVKDSEIPGKVMGSAPYVPPEIYKNEEAVPQSDLWGAGLLLYMMLTGVNPFYHRDVHQTILSIVNDEPKRRFGTIPWRLWPIVKQCLRKRPEQRFASAQELEKRLRSVIPKLKGDGDIGSCMRSIFSSQIRIENEFLRRYKVGTFTDALLLAEPKDIDKLFRTLRASQQPNLSSWPR